MDTKIIVGRGRSFRKLGLVVPILILAIFGAAFLVAYNVWNRMVADTIRSNDLKAGLIAKVIMEHEKAMIVALRSHAAQPLFINKVKKKDLDQILRHLEKLAKNNPEIEHIFIASPAGTLLINFPIHRETWDKDLSFGDWYKGVSKEWKPYVSVVYKMIIGEKHLAISVSIPVVDEGGKVIAILTGCQTTVFFQKLVNEIGLDLDAKVSLIDQKGQIIYSNRYPYRKEVLGYPSFDFVEAALSGQRGKAEVQDSSDENKTKYVSFAPVEGLGWSVVVEKAKGDIFRSELDVFAVIAAISALLILLAVVSGWYFRQKRDQITELAKLNQELDSRVKERTAEYETANRELKNEIEQRQQAEDALRKSEERLRTFIRHSLDGIIIIDSEGKILEWNEGEEQITGIHSSEAMSQPLWEIQYQLAPDEKKNPAFLGMTKEKILNGLKEGIGLKRVLEDEIQRPDGTRRIIQSVLFAIRSGTEMLAGGISRDITDRKRDDEALRASELRLNRSQEIAHLGSWELELLTNQLTWSNEVYRIFGLQPQEFAATYEAFLERVHPDDRAAVDAVYSGSLRGGKDTYEIEHRIIRRSSGEIRIVHEKCEHFRDASGRIIRSVGMVHDITDAKRAQKALQESEERYRRLFETMQEAFTLFEVITNNAGEPIDLRYLSVNPATERRFKLPREKIIGHTYREVVGNPDPEWIAMIGNVALTSKPVSVERYSRSFGNWLEIHAYSPSSGQCAVLSTDITVRKRMEDEIRRSRDELELRVQERTAEIRKQAELIELSHDAILVRDMEGRIVFWNQGAEKVYGWSKQEAMGQISHILLQAKFPQSLEETMEVLLSKEHWEGELAHTTRDGGRVTVLSRWAMQRDQADKAVAILEINTDITEHKRMEEELQQRHKMEALGTLAGGIAHDFNNLLMPILLNAELALLDVENGILPSADSLGLIKEGANRGKELVRQIIVFSRHKGQARRPVKIAPIMEEALKLLKSTVLKTVRVRTQIDTEPAMVLGDPPQIHQALVNIFINAAHSMPDKEGLLEVSLANVDTYEEPVPARALGVRPGPYLRLCVKDNGHGMTPEVKERAFDPFFTTKGPGKGSGMGLAVVHGIVKKHEGAIRLESEEGKGTTVSVFLPVFQGGEEERTPQDPVNIPQGKERILFVDDEEPQVRTVQPMLERLGYRVTAEMDPRRALDLFRSRPDSFDLVITDQVMPYLPGNRLAQELLGIRPGIPIILCTGFSETVDKEKAEAMGIREFILKPFGLNEIAQVIRKALGT